MSKQLSRRDFLRAAALTAAGATVIACQPKTVIVEKEKIVKETVEVEKEKIVKETVVVEVEKEKEVTKVVEVEKETIVTATPTPLKEAPALRGLVSAGDLSPVQERLPQNPVVVQPIDEIGQYGGSWTMLVAKASDSKLMHVYGYSRVAGWNQELTEIVPDLAESFEVVGGKEFTFKLRKGLRWSDGEPLTTEDFKYWWEDMQNNEEIMPSGPTGDLVPLGIPPTVTFGDAYTFTYAWETPHPYFLIRVAGPMAQQLFRPRHYMEQFHTAYGDKAAVDKMVADGAFEDWAALHGSHDRYYYQDDPDLPVMEPWLPTQPPPQPKNSFMRNPYFYKVDPDGKQLPYIDEFAQIVTDTKLIALKCSQGDSDFQSRGLGFADITLLKENEAQGEYQTRLWKSNQSNAFQLQPNWLCTDEVLRELIHDRRFRIAMSYAMDRKKINDVLYLGMGIIMQDELLPGVPGYNEAWATMHTEHDPDKANGLLDDMGLQWDGNKEYRLRPDGATLDLIIEDQGENPTFADTIELLTPMFKEIGIKVLSKSTVRASYRDRMMSGEAFVGTTGGGRGLNWFENNRPGRTVPIEGSSSVPWAWQYGFWHSSGGAEGVEPPEIIKKIQALGDAWLQAPNEEEQNRIRDELRAIYAEERFQIGTLGGLPAPVVVKTHMRNIPVEGFHAWDPGGYIGWIQNCQIWKE